jgi:hypothetical protein
MVATVNKQTRYAAKKRMNRLVASFNKQTRDAAKKRMNKLVASYTTLRNIMGFAGILIPLLCITYSLISSGTICRSSFSDYYYSYIGDIIVTLLCVQGAVLIIYNGYNTCEQITTTVAGITAILIANFATKPRNLDASFSVHTLERCVSHIGAVEIHLILALIFCGILTIIPFWWFTKDPSKKEEKVNSENIKKRFGMLCVKKIIQNNINNKQKAIRNFVYVICSLLIIGSFVGLAVFLCVGHHGPRKSIFIVEAIIFVAYSFSWLVKGNTFWADKGHNWIIRGFKRLIKCLC